MVVTKRFVFTSSPISNSLTESAKIKMLGTMLTLSTCCTMQSHVIAKFEFVEKHAMANFALVNQGNGMFDMHFEKLYSNKILYNEIKYHKY
jgi:hypothetical protein